MKSFILISILSLINLKSCVGQNCGTYFTDPPLRTFYLIQSDDYYHKMLNKNFRKMLDPRLRIKLVECNVTIKEMIQYAERGKLLINLYAQDFFNYNMNRLAKSLTYVSYTSNSDLEHINVEFCRTNKTKKIGDYETCTPSVETLEIYRIKLASNIIQKENGNVFRAVIDFERNFKPQKVVNCNFPNWARPNVEELYNGLNMEETCEIGQDVFVALAQKPQDIELRTDIPIIFYDESYLTSETKDIFKNAIEGVNTETMRNGLFYFLQKMEWYRIAVVTDESEGNINFEKQLTPYLRENGVALISETCMDRDCNFDEFFKTVEEHNIKVVIANVDQENLIKLRRSSILGHKKKWIVRDWSVEGTAEVSNYLGDIFIMTSFSIDKSSKYTNAVNALNSIMKTGKYCKYCKFSNSDVYNHLKATLRRTSSYKFTKITTRNQQNIGFVTFENGKITYENIFIYPYKEHVSDTGNCAIKVVRIQDSCDDKDLLILLMIVAVFFITILGIVYFFQSPIVSYQRFS